MLWLVGCVDYQVEEVHTGKPVFDSGEALDSLVVDTAAETADTAADSVTTTAPLEVCNGVDDDADGLVDEDFADTDTDGTADCVDPEECDGLDNDGDGAVDEGFDTDLDDIPDCLEVDHDVRVVVTADDAFDLWIDGVLMASGDLWSVAHEATAVLDSGPHVIAVHAWDVFGPPSALRAAAWVDGVETSGSGDGAWIYSRVDPGVGWESLGFDTSAFTLPDVCEGSPWGAQPAELVGTTSLWVWEGDCTGVGEAWFRWEPDLP